MRAFGSACCIPWASCNRLKVLKNQIIFGFHAVGVRLKVAAPSVQELYFDPQRRDARMQQLLTLAQSMGCRPLEANALRLTQLAGSLKHQGVVAVVSPWVPKHSLDDVLAQATEPPLLLVLDGVSDPHNLGACLRVADAAGAHAVVAPKDRAVGLNATVEKVACGAAQTVPYIVVTNLARTLAELQEQGVFCIGTAEDAEQTIYQLPTSHLQNPVAWVMGAEGKGLRELTRKRCDSLVSLPMYGSVESLNVSVASGICLYETRRQRIA